MASLNEMSPRGQFLLFLILAAVIVGAGEYVWLSAPSAANAATRQQIQTVERQNAVLRPYARQAELLRAENQTLQRQLTTLLAIVPAQKTTDQFVRDLQAAALGSTVFIRRVTVKPTVKKDFYVEAPYELALDGSYVDLQRFYDRLAHLQRIVDVEDIQMDGLIPTGTGGGYQYDPDETVSAVCTVTTFFSAEQTPPAPARPGMR